MPIRVECPECRAAFQVADQHAGKRGRCPRCKTMIAVAGAAPATPPPDSPANPVAPLIEAPPHRQQATEPPGEDDGGLYELADAPARASRVAARLASKTPQAPPPSAAPTTPTRTPAEILAAFRGRIEPVRPTALYRLWILIVAGVMILLPLVYLALIGLIAWLTYWHATTNHTIFSVIRGGRSVQVAAIVYLGPIVLGVVMVAFMLKPILARPPKGPRTRKLDPNKQPLVFAFVDGVCTTVGAPTPARIEVDCDVNASARLDTGPLSRDLILTIGLPLVSGLSLRQFAGVLAHEFGHFSQRIGMRVSYLIRSINVWFARVVYQRDSWDESLDQAAQQQGMVAAFGLTAKAGVWLTRRILWVLMKLAQLVSSVLSRQMEFDADRYEARLVGGTTFAETQDRLRVLSLASQGAYADLSESWKEGRLPNDLPRLVLNNVPQIPERVLAQVRQAHQSAKTDLFSTHPADADRVASAQADTPGPGVFSLDGPATDLFRDFASLCRDATRDHYRGSIGLKIDDAQLYPVEEVEQSQQILNEGNSAFTRFFRNQYGGIRPLPLPASLPAAAADVATARDTLIRSRAHLEANGEAYGAAVSRWGEWRGRAAAIATAATFLKTGVKFKGSDLELPGGREADVEAARREAEAALAKIETKLSPFEKAAADRLVTALSLIERDDVAARVDQGPLRRQEAGALYPTASLLGRRVFPNLPDLYQAQFVLLRTLERHQHAPQSEPHVNAVLRAARALRDTLELIRTHLGNTLAYPFEHAQENATLGRFAFPEPSLPAPEAVGELLSLSDEVQDRLVKLQVRVLGRLCLVAEEVETAIGLPVLEPPPEPEAEAAEG